MNAVTGVLTFIAEIVGFLIFVVIVLPVLIFASIFVICFGLGFGLLLIAVGWVCEKAFERPSRPGGREPYDRV